MLVAIFRRLEKNCHTLSLSVPEEVSQLIVGEFAPSDGVVVSAEGCCLAILDPASLEWRAIPDATFFQSLPPHIVLSVTLLLLAASLIGAFPKLFVD